MTTIPNNKRIAIIGGGTNSYISNHLALSAPAYGTTAKILYYKFQSHTDNKMSVDLYLTKMASPSTNPTGIPSGLDTPEDVEALVDKLVADPDTRVIIFNVAMVDFKPNMLLLGNGRETITDFGKYTRRLSSNTSNVSIYLSPYQKIINKIRKERKDILLVGFKTTCGATKEELFNKGLKLCKDAFANIVFVNDVDKERIEKLDNLITQYNQAKEKCYGWVYSNSDDAEDQLALLVREREDIKTRIAELQNNGLVTPEESSYWYNTRDDALNGLVQMVLDRSHLHFTRSTVVDSETIAWSIPTLKIAPKHYIKIKQDTDISKGEVIQMPNPIIPETFRTVFDWVRSQGAYKKGPTGATVGHFGIKLGSNEFLTSKRKTDFNKIEEVGLVRVITDDPDNVFGYKHFFESEDTQIVNQIAELEIHFRKLDIGDSSRDGVIDELNYLKEQLLEVTRDDKVIAFGAKPSVGGQSQRSLFDTFPDLNCIVHFHCPLKTEYRAEFNTTPQFSFECGSKECITSNITGFKEYKVSDTHSIWAGHMDHHGPNIVFNSDIDPQLVIDFINKYWDLTRKTDGLSKDNI